MDAIQFNGQFDQGMNYGKLRSELKKPRKRGPTSTTDVRKTKSIDAFIGAEPIEFSEEENDGEKEQDNESNSVEKNSGLGQSSADMFQAPLSPKSSLQEIIRQEEVCRDFDYFLQANCKCYNNVQQGLGHSTIDCKKKQGGQQQWVVKNNKKPAVNEAGNSKQQVDNEGFQQVSKGPKLRSISIAEEPGRTNPYQVLADNFEAVSTAEAPNVQAMATTEEGATDFIKIGLNQVATVEKTRGGGDPPRGNE
uniref:Uncharacterized protein n=1 Tax=Cannabis sativa TaxID=3483 RepID=A0A803PBP0_CANSA